MYKNLKNFLFFLGISIFINNYLFCVQKIIIEEDIETCSICLEKINKDIKITQCNHKFHKRCIDQWVKEYKHNTCPNCRAILKTKNKPKQSLYKIYSLILVSLPGTCVTRAIITNIILSGMPQYFLQEE